MKTYTFSGKYRRSQEFDYEVTVTSKISPVWGWPPEYIASHQRNASCRWKMSKQ
jgi:hypothetical protein